MTASVIRWRGGPGAGKSSALLEYVRSEVAAGATISDFALMTFSRAQAADLAARLHTTVFPDETADTILSRCATIDAIALRACRAAGLIDNPREVIIQPGDPKKAWVYGDFMAAHALEFNPAIGTDTEEGEESLADLPIGNALIALNAYLSATMRPPEEWQTAAAALGLPILPGAWPIVDLLHAWTEHKAQLGVWEHADYAALALRENLPPPAPILVVDEYQDVSPLQDALIRQWINHPDTSRVYVAGDEDQSIYGFRGCDPSLLQSIPARDLGAQDDGDRPVSHRCPAEVMKAAETILSHRANVAPCNRRGIVRHVRPTSTEGLAAQIEEAIRHARHSGWDGPIFILCRFKRHVRRLARAVSAAGIPCTSLKERRVRRWREVKIGRTAADREATMINLWTLTRAIRRYLDGFDFDIIPMPEAEVLIFSVLTGKKRNAALTDLKIKAKVGPVRLGDLFRWTGGALGEGIFDLLNLPSWAVSQTRACIAREKRRGYAVSPDTVIIDTIHASKGLEAAVVILHTGYLKGRIAGLTDPDRAAEERRIYFTGATRAADTLLLLDFGEAPPCPFLVGVGA